MSDRWIDLGKEVYDDRFGTHGNKGPKTSKKRQEFAQQYAELMSEYHYRVEHGHGETKTTCLWTRGLPFLHPSNVVEGRASKCWLSPDSKNRWKRRSVTFQGVAEAMADQWGAL